MLTFIPSFIIIYVALIITNGPSNTITCIRSRADIYCGYTGGNPNFVTVEWMITKINSDGSVSNLNFQGSNIRDPTDGFQWAPDLTNGNNSRLIVGPVDETFNRSSYQCSILLSDGTTIASTTGILTVIGKLCTYMCM